MNKYFEEFLRKYKEENSLEKRVELIWDSGEIYFDSGGEHLAEILKQEIKNCKEENYLDGEVVLRLLFVQLNLQGADLVNLIGEINFVSDNVEKIQNRVIAGFAYMFLGISSAYQGDYAKAFDLVLLAKKSYIGYENHRQYGWVDYNLGVIHSDLKDYNSALEKFYSAIEFFRKFEFEYGIARCQTGMAAVLVQKNELEEAEKLYLKALNVFKDLRMQSALSRIYNDLGVINRKRKLFKKAIEFLSQALEIRKSINHSQGIATTLNDLSEVYLDFDQPEKAIKLLNESVELCKQIHNLYKLSNAHQLLYISFKKLNQPENALYHIEEYTKFQSQVTSATTNNKIKELEKRAAAEQAEKIASLEREKNAELKLAFDLIEEKNKEILDSINYAKRIQYTLLASENVLKEYLPNHFVFFQPKDIVSGDFYWFSHSEDGKTFYLAVCDSTGHGVPGAFMSLLNITYLNEAINEKNIIEPGEILDYVREKLIKNISQDGAKDGMDATLVKFEVGSSISEIKITYAAAHNSPFVFRNGEIIELSFDKMPVGKGENDSPFTTHQMEIKQGDIIYLGTDGYADQFGGEKFGVSKAGGKKFKKSNLKKLLSSVNHKSLIEQKEILHHTFEEWKGSLEQVDDVCIIGIQL